MITIASMKVKHFLSFQEAAFSFRDAGLTFVEGENLDDKSAHSNGSGKSAMIDALVWCLFGVTLRGYENDEVIHRKTDGDCLVTVRLIDNDEMYEVSRARRHSKLKNSLRVIATNQGGEDTDLSGASNAETQEVVEKILGCSRRTFMSSVVFGQDRAYRFSSLTDKEQKEILDEVLGVERFAVACNLARGQMAVHGTSAEIARRDLNKAEQAAAAARDEVEEMRDKDESFEDERKGKIKEQREKLTKAKEWVKKNSTDRTEKLKAEPERLQKLVTAQEKEVTARTKDVTEAKVARATIKSKVDEIRANVKKHEALVGDCPTCGQRVDNVQHKRVLTDLKRKLAGATEVFEKSEEVVTEFETALDKAQRKLTGVRNDMMTAQRVLNEAVAETANLVSWKRRVKDHEERIAELEKETNPYAALAKKADGRRERHEAEVKLLTEQLAAEEGKLKLADFWVKAFGAKGLRSLLIDTALPMLNEEAARISRAVTGGAIKVEFNTTSELKSGKTVDKFEVKVDNKYGAGSYLGNSAGERAKADLCVGLALQRLVASRSSASFNVCFFDEVFDHLDSAAHERVIDVLSEIDKESVYVVSHNDDLKAWFPSSVRIVKEGGFSRVEA